MRINGIRIWIWLATPRLLRSQRVLCDRCCRGDVVMTVLSYLCLVVSESFGDVPGSVTNCVVEIAGVSHQYFQRLDLLLHTSAPS